MTLSLALVVTEVLLKVPLASCSSVHFSTVMFSPWPTWVALVQPNRPKIACWVPGLAEKMVVNVTFLSRPPPETWKLVDVNLPPT